MELCISVLSVIKINYIKRLLIKLENFNFSYALQFCCYFLVMKTYNFEIQCIFRENSVCVPKFIEITCQAFTCIAKY